ncbi:MAG: hypothetical protein ACREOG_05370 [Gemmatimonadaceae bacterium]
MTGAPWDAVPPVLAARMQEMIGSDGAHSSHELLDAAISGLASLAKQDPSEHVALDLLAIDGLATAAFASVRDETELVELADRAAKELMALGDPGA